MSTDSNNPMEAARSHARPALPARFYAQATAHRTGDQFVLLLDGKPARTPARHALSVPGEALARALAAEWNAQVAHIDSATMPVTRLVNAALDRVAGDAEEVRRDIIRYAGNDLLFYRAEEPDSLVVRQREAWDPLVAWAGRELGTSARIAKGVVHKDQPTELVAAVGDIVAPLDVLPLTGVHAVTTLTGSAVLALAVLRRHLDADEAWQAAHVDEDWQMERWGRDDMALSHRQVRRAELDAAVLAIRTRPRTSKSS